MEGYLGETIVKQKDTKFKNFVDKDWAMYFLERYGWIDGAHHKDWVLDQIARILNETPIIIKIAKWKNGQEEYRINTGKPSNKYKQWVIDMCNGEDGPNTYSYNEGINP